MFFSLFQLQRKLPVHVHSMAELLGLLGAAGTTKPTARTAQGLCGWDFGFSAPLSPPLQRARPPTAPHPCWANAAGQRCLPGTPHATAPLSPGSRTAGPAC